MHGRRLAQALDVNPALLAWFACLHDSQRHDEGTDRGHGSRAADCAVRLRQRGVIQELAPREFEWLCEAMRLHSDGRTEGEPALRACWDPIASTSVASASGRHRATCAASWPANRARSRGRWR